MRRSSSTVYLLSLAVSDTAFLLSFIIAHSLTNLRCMFAPSATFDVFNQFELACGGLQYLLDLFSNWSALIILFFTTDRYLACYHTVRYLGLCTPRRATVTCSTSLVVLALLIAPYHAVGMGLHRTEEGYQVPYCIISKVYREIFAYCYMAEVIVFRVLPILVIAVLNWRIMLKVRAFHSARAQRRNNTARNLHELTALCENQSESAVAKSSNVQNVQCTEKTTHVQKRNANCTADQNESNAQLSIMLMVVSTTYIILYFPVLVDFLLRATILESRSVASSIAYYVARTLDVAAFAVNFFLYTLSGTEFRKQLGKMLHLENVAGGNVFCSKGNTSVAMNNKVIRSQGQIVANCKKDNKETTDETRL